MAEGRGSETQELKLLGVKWNTEVDFFQFDYKEVVDFMKSLLPTKCSVLRLSAKVFDPLGLLSPFVIGTNTLFQTFCKSNGMQHWRENCYGSGNVCWKNLRP